MSDSRDERRRIEKAEERKRREELDRLLEQPRLPSFEAPASGIIRERPASIERSRPPAAPPPPPEDDSADP